MLTFSAPLPPAVSIGSHSAEDEPGQSQVGQDRVLDEQLRISGVMVKWLSPARTTWLLSDAL
jgi:hypothetical protein